MCCKFCNKIYSYDYEPTNEAYIIYDKDTNKFHICAVTGDSFCYGWVDDIKHCPYCGKELKGDKHD